MIFLHVIPPSKRYMASFLEMLKRHFNENDGDTHKIMVHNELFKTDSPLLLFDNLVHFPDMGKGRVRKFLYIKKAFEDADRIVFHSFQPDDKWLLLCYILRDYLDKAVWIIWGIDMYNYKLSGKSLKARIKNSIGKDLRKRMHYPVVISEPDIERYKLEFGTYPVVCAAYPFMDARFNQMDKFSEQWKKKKELYYKNHINEDEIPEFLKLENNVLNIDEYDGRTRILVGHNAYQFNNHVASLDLLERFISMEGAEKLELCLPLSYGETKLTDNVYYHDAIIRYALMKAPFNVSFLTNLVSSDEYTRFLSTIDIGVFNAERQSGLGNILQLLYMGKKIYMSRKNPLFAFLVKKGFTIHDVDELKYITLEELLTPDEKSSAKEWIKSTRNIENLAKAWDVVFDFVKGELDADIALEKNLKYLGD